MTLDLETQEALAKRIAALGRALKRIERKRREKQAEEERRNLNRPHSTWTWPGWDALDRVEAKILKDMADLQAKQITPAHGDGGLDPEDPDLPVSKVVQISDGEKFLARLSKYKRDLLTPAEEEIVVDEDELEAEMRDQLGETKR